MAGLAGKIAEFIAQTGLNDLPRLARDRGTRAVVDTIGVITAGAASPTLAAMRRYAEETRAPGDIPVLGGGFATDAEHAALLNGMSGHALDFDDGYPYYPVHASVVIVSALISTADAKPLGGAGFLESYIVGFEVVTALGRGLGMGHYMNRGFHATGTLGVFAAVAALAKREGLDAETTRRSIGIAASMASGLQRNFGTMMKAFHSGWAARNALIAVRMAQHGVTAHAEAMDGANGFFRAYGDDTADLDRAAGLLGPPFALVEHGVGMKKFPCVNAAARPLAGLLELRATHGLTPANVERIVCVLPPGSTKPMHYHRPKTGLEGQFSLEYVLAAGLLDGRVGIATFGDDMIRRKEIQPLLGRIAAVEDPRCIAEDPLAETRGPGPRGFVEVQVATSSGEKLSSRVDVAPGYPGRELSPDEMWEKFADCASYASVGQAPARAAFDALMDLENLDDMMRVLRPLRADAAGRASGIRAD